MELKELDISTRKINQLKNKNINTVEELVKFFPRNIMILEHLKKSTC
jgi:DNA-directed RNA polymerase alpha subunit